MNKMNDFTPEYLKTLRIQQETTLNEEQIESVKKQILKANLQGKCRTIITLIAESSWGRTIEYFRDNGFWVDSYGNDYEDDYDEDGNLVYNFIFNWYIDEDNQ